MKAKLIVLLLMILTGCSSVDVTSVVKTPAHKAYSRILTLCIHSDLDFSQLDSTFYNSYVKNKFNDVDNLKNRDQLEWTLKNKIEKGEFPQLVKSSDLFKVDTEYDYQTFMKTIKESGVDAILVMNLRRFWQSSRCESTQVGEATIDKMVTSPNCTYFCYLLDSNDLSHYLWVGKIVVYGRYGSNKSLNKDVGSVVANRLRREKLIH